MAEATKNPPANSSNASKPGSEGKKRVRLSREQKGLPPLTPSQRMQRQIVQNAENACKFIKESIDKGEQPSAEVLAACSTLSGALSGMIGA